MLELLDNVVWHALVGPHAQFSEGTGSARRYHADVTSLMAFQTAESPDFGALRPYCRSGERLYCLGWRGAVPEGWNLEVESTVVKMVWDAPAPSANDLFVPTRLDSSHVRQAQALADATHPGPFGGRTIELGEYLGYFDDERLVAMAGERMRAGNLREVSAVCTYPEHQGKGLARGLMLHLMREQLRRGERPFLHVMQHSKRALQLYRRMGFRVYREMVVRVVSVF